MAGRLGPRQYRIDKIPGDCVDKSNTVEGAVPAVGPNGEVYVAWAGPTGIMFNRSVDGGVTWLQSEIKVSDQPGGWYFSIPGLFRCNGLPNTACDLSTGPRRGTIYVNWSDQRNGSTNTDIWLSKSTDGGDHWTPPNRVNDDSSGRHQFFPWMTLDQSDGTLYIVFYDRRNYSDNVGTDVYLASSRDGGATFVNVRISQSRLDLTGSGFLGDYINVSACNGVVRPIWTRIDGVWTALIDPPPRINSVSLANGVLQLSLTNLASYLTNYIEASFDVGLTDSWSRVDTFTGIEGGTNWTEPVNANFGAAFYRVRSY